MKNIIVEKPEILTGVGLVMLGGGFVLYIHQKPKADEALAKKKEELEVEKLPIGEVVKSTAPHYIWPILLAAGGTACIIAGDVVSHNKCVQALATAALTEGALEVTKNQLELKNVEANTLKEEIATRLGEDVAKEVQEAVEAKKAEKVISKIPEEKVLDLKGSEDADGYIFSNPDEQNFIIDSITGSVYRGTWDNVRDAELEFIDILKREDYASAKEWSDVLDSNLTKVSNNVIPDYLYAVGWDRDDPFKVHRAHGEWGKNAAFVILCESDNSKGEVLPKSNFKDITCWR